MTKPLSDYKFLIGIDTGVNTGICAYNRHEKKIYFIATMMIHEAMEKIANWHKTYPGQLFVRVEDARLRKWIPKQKDMKAELGRREGAGSVKRDAQIWEGFLKGIGVPYEMVPPKNNKTKTDASLFVKLTGYDMQTSNHSRDAAMLVFGY